MVCIDLPFTVHKQLRRLAVEEDKSLRGFIKDLLIEIAKEPVEE